MILGSRRSPCGEIKAITSSLFQPLLAPDNGIVITLFLYIFLNSRKHVVCLQLPSSLGYQANHLQYVFGEVPS